MEFINPEGLRIDGRRPKELRRLQCQLGTLTNANGSAAFEIGHTKVVAVVYGPHEVSNRGDIQHDRAIVNVDVGSAAFGRATARRAGRTDRRAAEAARALKGALEQTIATELLPRSQVDVFVHILAAEGGVLAACINAAMLALAHAGVPLRDMIAACTVGYLESTPLLDLNHLEEAGDGATLTLAAHVNLDAIPLLQLDDKLPMETLETVMELAQDGTKAVGQWLRQQLLGHVQQLAACRNVGVRQGRGQIVEMIMETNPDAFGCVVSD